MLETLATQATPSTYMITWRDKFGTEGDGREKGMVRFITHSNSTMTAVKYTGMVPQNTLNVNTGDRFL